LFIEKEKHMNRDILEKHFGQEQIKQREGNFGKMLDYIEGHAVIQRLNDAFDADWSFTIIRYDIFKETDEVLVQGELKAGNVVKMQFGSSKITHARKNGDIISLGDDLKAAATDALKKAATLFGVGLHLYRNDGQQQGSQHNGSSGNRSGSNGGNDNRSGANGGNGNGNGSGSNGGNNTHPPINGGNGGNGSNNPSVSDDNGNGRLSAKQFRYLQKLNGDLGRASADLEKIAVAMFGVKSQFLSKGDASSLISHLLEK
jgi:Rad52/22 family double-strand break repair protein